MSDTITGTSGSDTLTGGAGSDIFAYITVSDSAASVAADAVRSFDLITDFKSGTGLDRFDISAVADQLANGDAQGLLITTLNTGSNSLNSTSLATFADLKASIDALGLIPSAAGPAGSSTGLQAYLIDLTGNTGALGQGLYLLLNNNDLLFSTEDLLIELTGVTVLPVSTDFGI